MTADEVRLYLHDIRSLKYEITAKENVIAEVRSMAERTTAVLSETSIHHSGHRDRVGYYSVRLVELYNELEESINRLIDTEKNILKVIDLVSDPLKRAILTEYYVSGLTCDTVADNIGYSTRHVRKLISDSCKEIAATIPIYLIPERYLKG